MQSTFYYRLYCIVRKVGREEPLSYRGIWSINITSTEKDDIISNISAMAMLVKSFCNALYTSLGFIFAIIKVGLESSVGADHTLISPQA